MVITNPSCSNERREWISKCLGMPLKDFFGLYLGIPSDFESSKKEIFKAMIKKIEDCLSGWNSIFLSPAWRITLINSVLAALGNHIMSVFRVPAHISNRMNSIMAKFWWNGTRKGQGLHMRSWKQITRPRDKGGLGFTDIKILNQALLAKQSWRVLKNKASALSSIYRAKYKLNEECLFEQNWEGIKGSWGWSSIKWGLGAL